MRQDAGTLNNNKKVMGMAFPSVMSDKMRTQHLGSGHKQPGYE